MARIEPITAEQFEVLLPMIADYQRFYEVEEIDERRNRDFFARFIDPSENGTLIAPGTGRLLGYACLYWHTPRSGRGYGADERPLRRCRGPRPGNRPRPDRSRAEIARTAAPTPRVVDRARQRTPRSAERLDRRRPQRMVEYELPVQ